MIGSKTRLQYANIINGKGIYFSLVPIVKLSRVIHVQTQNNYQIVRQQFTLISAESIRILKSEG